MIRITQPAFGCNRSRTLTNYQCGKKFLPPLLYQLVAGAKLQAASAQRFRMPAAYPEAKASVAEGSQTSQYSSTLSTIRLHYPLFVSTIHYPSPLSTIRLHYPLSVSTIRLHYPSPLVTLIEIVSSDLKRTTATGNWKVGRKLQVRVHLAVYLLQVLYNLTDRKVEYGVRDNVAREEARGVCQSAADSKKANATGSRILRKITAKKLAALPWNIRRAINQIKAEAWRYLLDVGYFTRTNTIKKGKILSLFAKAVAYIDKKKVRKSANLVAFFSLGESKEILFLCLRQLRC